MENKEIKLREKAQEITSLASGLEITNHSKNQVATDYLKIIKDWAKKATLYWDEVVKPAYASYKAALAKKKDCIDKYNQAEKIVKDKMRKFLVIEEEKARKLQEKVEKEAEKQGIEAPQIRQHKTDGQIKRKQWYAVVKDKSKVPLDYLEPDMQKLNGVARAKKGESGIPGVEFKSKIVIGIR